MNLFERYVKTDLETLLCGSSFVENVHAGQAGGERLCHSPPTPFPATTERRATKPDNEGMSTGLPLRGEKEYQFGG